VTPKGEFERIELFIREFRLAGGALAGPQVPLGPGDDAAIVKARGPLAITTDALVEDVHFRRGWGTWEQVGYKALAVNLSDLAAMGARPVGFTCALGLPPDVGDEILAAIARGLARLALPHNAILAGGNFTRAREVSLTITAFGELDGQPLRRDGARVGDSILLVGDVGVAAAELRVLQQGGALLAGRSALLEPFPQIEAGHLAMAHARCAIDVSDGLAQDLEHVARASALRLRISFAHVPVSDRFRGLTEASSEAERAHLLLAGGEDYSLVVVAPPTSVHRLCRDLPAAQIGVVEEGRGLMIDGLPSGTRLEGHDHFR
jgi:thiamine-monophosphate kinase